MQRVEVTISRETEKQVKEEYPMVYFCINKLSKCVRDVDLHINGIGVFDRYDNVKVIVYPTFTFFYVTRDSYTFEYKERVIKHDEFKRYEVTVW